MQTQLAELVGTSYSYHIIVVLLSVFLSYNPSPQRPKQCLCWNKHNQKSVSSAAEPKRIWPGHWHYQLLWHEKTNTFCQCFTLHTKLQTILSLLCLEVTPTTQSHPHHLSSKSILYF